MSLSKAALRNYQFSIIALLLLVILGTVSLLTMPRSEDPQFDFPAVMISVVSLGTSPEDMEKQVVDKIEEAINELEDLKVIKSDVEDGLSVSRVEFLFGTDPEDKYDDVVGAIARIRGELPAGLQRLSIEKISPADINIMQLAMVSKDASYRDLKYYSGKLEKRLQRLSGVKRVDVVAYPEQQVQVIADLPRMRQLGISMRQLVASIQGESANIPAGHVNAGSRRFTVKTSGDLDSLDTLRNSIVNPGATHPVIVKDIAQVSIADAPPSYLAVVDDTPAVFVSVVQRKGTNIFNVIDGVKVAVESFAQDLPENIQIKTVHDQSLSVSERINGFFDNLLQGLVLVGAMAFLVLGFRASFVVVVAIPMSVLIALGWLDFTGFGLQQMSIVGLVIALGLLVDNAIVVTDNVARYASKESSSIVAAEKGVEEVAMSVISGTITTVLSFFPILLLQTGSGTFMRSMPVTVVLTLFASLLVAITFSPLLASRLLKKKQKKPPLVAQYINRLANGAYRSSLTWVLRFPKTIMLVAVAIFVGSIMLMPIIGTSLFPKAEKPALLINIELPEGASFEKTFALATKIDNDMRKYALVKSVARNIGKGNPRIYYNEFPRRQVPNYAQLYIQLTHYEVEEVAEFIKSVREDFAKIPEAKVTLKEFMQGPPAEAPIEIRLVGDNLTDLRTAAQMTEDIVASIEGTVSIDNPMSKNKVDLQVNINRAKAAIHGIAVADIDQAVRTYLVGQKVGIYRDNQGEDYPVVVRASSTTEPNITEFEDMVIANRQGQLIPLSQVASLSFRTVIPRFQHHNLERMARVTSDVERGYETEALTNQIIEKLTATEFPAGVKYLIGGEQENRKESFGGMMQAFLIALMGIFAVLVLQFRSFQQPLIIFAAIPFAISGAIFGLYLTGYTFSFTAFVGLTSLIGIVVNNSIILVDMANQNRAKGMNLEESIITSGVGRLSPILLTTLTTVGGLLPLTLQNSTMWSPMGWAIISGLMLSTFLTLFVVPILYKWFTPKVIAE